MRRLFLVLPILLLAACASSKERYDSRLAKFAGLSEQSLIAKMGRAPDSRYQADPQTLVLKWRYDVPPRAETPTYNAMGDSWKPVAKPDADRERGGCIVDWTVVNGMALTYSSRGTGCKA